MVAEGTDANSNLAHVVAVIETPSINGFDVKLKAGERVKVSFNLQQREVKIEGPDPQAILAQLQQFGGLLVTDGLVTRIEIDENDANGATFKFESDGTLKITAAQVTLRVTATDTMGESDTADASPIFPYPPRPTNWSH